MKFEFILFLYRILQLFSANIVNFIVFCKNHFHRKIYTAMDDPAVVLLKTNLRT